MVACILVTFTQQTIQVLDVTVMSFVSLPDQQKIDVLRMALIRDVQMYMSFS